MKKNEEGRIFFMHRFGLWAAVKFSFFGIYNQNQLLLFIKIKPNRVRLIDKFIGETIDNCLK